MGKKKARHEKIKYVVVGTSDDDDDNNNNNNNSHNNNNNNSKTVEVKCAKSFKSSQE